MTGHGVTATYTLRVRVILGSNPSALRAHSKMALRGIRIAEVWVRLPVSPHFIISVYRKRLLTSFSTIVKIEAGKNKNPTLETLTKIAKALNVSVDDLIK